MRDSIRVLHVDDDPAVADLAATFLERENERFAVETATSAAEGLEVLEAGAFDCVVSDYDMPGRTGIEFLEAVRADYPDLPFVLFTGKGSEEVASEAISAGVTDYLQKETGTDQYAVLANRIENAVEHDRSRRMVERSRRRLRKIVDSLPHLLFVVDGDGRYRLANEVMADFHDTTVDEIEGGHATDVLEPDEAEQFLADVADVIESGEAKRIPVVEVVDPAGETHLFEPRLLPYDLADTDERAVLAISVEITDREERKHELERARERVDLALEHTDAVVFDIDLETGEVTRHGSFERFFEVAPEEAPTWRDLLERAVHPADREAFRTFHERLIDGERDGGEIEYRVAPDDGEVRWLRATVHVEDAGDGRRALGVSRDVTEQKARERRLEALNESTRALLRADTREGVAEAGAAAARDVLGLEANAIYLFDEERDALVPAAATDRTRDLVGEPPTFTGADSIAWRVFETGEARAVDDVHDDPDVYDADSPMHSELFLPIDDEGLLLAGSPDREAFDHDDLVVGEILAGHVATALEQVERTEQVRARERELQRQNERLAEFASIVSHDLRNPLSVAEGRLELAQAECESDHLDEVARALDRMETLIDDLLTLAREGDRVQEMAAVDLSDLVRSAWRNVDTAGATLVADAERTIRADRSRLAQLLENLVRNAVEHGAGRDGPTREGGDAGTDLTVTIGDLADGSGFYVADDGPGIPPDERDRVFESGYSTAEGGTGFGLSIVRQIAEAHGWEIDVTESDAGGARFEIRDVELAD